jgi:putative transposase
MRRIDELHLDYPFVGSRMLRDLLRGEGVEIWRERVARMMRRMDIVTIYARPTRQNPVQVTSFIRICCADDISYTPIAQGFVYMVAVVDWFSRRILPWRLSIGMDVDFCLEAVVEALAKYSRQEIFNTDQGGQFTLAFRHVHVP